MMREIVRKNLWSEWSRMKLTLTKEVEGQITLEFSVIEFYVAQGMDSHDTLLHSYYMSHGGGREEEK